MSKHIRSKRIVYVGSCRHDRGRIEQWSTAHRQPVCVTNMTRDDADSEPACIIDGHYTGIYMLMVQQRCNQPNHCPEGEEQHNLVVRGPELAQQRCYCFKAC